MKHFYFEISPLFENQFTGIPQVAKYLAVELLSDSDVTPHFFLSNKEIDPDFVRLAIYDDSGFRLKNLFWQYSIDLRPEMDSYALFPNYKSVVGVFKRESFVLHDLSTVCTPQFHTAETVREHITRMERDISTSDYVFCVSEATKDDAVLYYPRFANKFVVSKNSSQVIKCERLNKNDGRLLITILGTLEPRKNIEVVLKFVFDNPSIADLCRFVFPGKVGWGKSYEEMVDKYRLQPLIDSGVLVFPGFISEDSKHSLLANSDLLIYPSVYEGFGLPVLEAALHKVPVLTTRSTSITEIKGGAIEYFSPFVDGDFSNKLISMIDELDRLQNDASRFVYDYAWCDMYRTIKDKLLD